MEYEPDSFKEHETGDHGPVYPAPAGLSIFPAPETSWQTGHCSPQIQGGDLRSWLFLASTQRVSGR
jgi:hypothetical protein